MCHSELRKNPSRPKQLLLLAVHFVCFFVKGLVLTPPPLECGLWKDGSFGAISLLKCLVYNMHHSLCNYRLLHLCKIEHSPICGIWQETLRNYPAAKFQERLWFRTTPRQCNFSLPFNIFGFVTTLWSVFIWGAPHFFFAFIGKLHPCWSVVIWGVLHLWPSFVPVGGLWHSTSFP